MHFHPIVYTWQSFDLEFFAHTRTWVAKFEAGELKKDYFFVGSQKECEEIVESNKALYSSRMGANS
ncbi:hypothetical protein ACWP61_000053 [Acinetobacter baumannii]